jgi:hypothetical protein
LIPPAEEQEWGHVPGKDYDVRPCENEDANERLRQSIELSKELIARSERLLDRHRGSGSQSGQPQQSA